MVFGVKRAGLVKDLEEDLEEDLEGYLAEKEVDFRSVYWSNGSIYSRWLR